MINEVAADRSLRRYHLSADDDTLVQVKYGMPFQTTSGGANVAQAALVMCRIHGLFSILIPMIKKLLEQMREPLLQLLLERYVGKKKLDGLSGGISAKRRVMRGTQQETVEQQ